MSQPAPQRWLVKSEPEKYPWSALVRDGKTFWDGVRNFQARNNLRAMKTGDRVLYYHSVEEKAVVGLAQVVREAWPDPTATEGDWSVVDLAPVKAFSVTVPLEQIKHHPQLGEMPLVRHSRLSVQPVSEEAFRIICALGGLTEIP